jgi:hypothetical protein
VQDSLEGKHGEIECESRKVEVQCNYIKKCVLGVMSDLVEKVERIKRKP